MSLIGPRPLLVEYLCRYNSHQARRHEVRPGITGWAQVNGRNTIGWEDRFNLDVFYVDQLSAWLDLRILIMTVLKVLQRSDVNSDNHVTMERFQGSPEPNNSQHN
jgi:lipopolysaccharide/colanic/teichoic acid biosynthesis glycosyltransferase